MPGQSFVDLYFNGDEFIHSSVYYWGGTREKPVYGIHNTTHARWPVEYQDSEGRNLNSRIDALGRDVEKWHPGDSDEKPDKGKPTHDNDADSASAMPAADDAFDDEGEDDFNDEDEDDAEPEEEDGEDEKDDPADDDDVDPQDDEDDDNDTDEDSEPDADDEDENSDSESDEGDEDGDTSSDENSDNEGDGESEEDDVRLTIFSKMRGPKGWRKRAESNPEADRNVFGFKVGILDDTDPDATPGQMEKDVRVHAEFIETEADKSAGILRLKVPEGTLFEQKGGWWVAVIPYDDPDEE
jgi:hypothetical protein